MGPLEDQDDYLHPPGPVASWRESFFFGFYDQAGRVCLSYLSVAPRPGMVERILILQTPGVGSTLFCRHRDPLQHFRDTALAEGALQVHCRVPLQSWQIRAEAPCLPVPPGQEISSVLASTREKPLERIPVAFDLHFEALMPAYRFPAGTWDFLGPGQEHFEQAGSITGWMRIGDEETPCSGLCGRDRSWGPRDWLGYQWYHWINLPLCNDLIISAALGRANGQEVSSGFVYREGLLQPIVQVAVQVDRDPQDLHLLAGAAHVVTGAGQTYELHFAPIRFFHTIVAQGDNWRSHDAYTVVTCRCEGVTGQGFVEYAQREPILEHGPARGGLW